MFCTINQKYSCCSITKRKCYAQFDSNHDFDDRLLYLCCGDQLFLLAVTLTELTVYYYVTCDSSVRVEDIYVAKFKGKISEIDNY